jgi:hypothetical protein
MTKKLKKIVSSGLKIPARIAFNIITRRSYPKGSRASEWSIGIYKGASPLAMTEATDIHNPVLTATHVTDVKADFVADPFMIKEGGTWFMFFEVLNSLRNKGEIGVATSPDARRWTYVGICLREPFHLSYPQVFKWQGELYMIPEGGGGKQMVLYKAKKFPTVWEPAAVLLDGEFTDHSLFRFHDTWWLFAGCDPLLNNILRLFHAENLTGPWQEHVKSPILSNDPRHTRPAGAAVVMGKEIIRFAQDCAEAYGSKVYAFVIDRLSKTEYRERPFPGNPILQPGPSVWQMHGMHHINPHEIAPGQWIACVDGYKRKLRVEAEY